MGAGACAEDFENEPRAIDDLSLPAPLQIALLHRRQRAIDDDEADLLLVDRRAEGVDAATADQGARRGPREAHDLTADDIKIDRPGETDRLVEPGIEGANGTVARLVTAHSLQGGMNDEGTARRRGRAGSGQTVLSAAQG